MVHPSESVTFSNCDGRERDEAEGPDDQAESSHSWASVWRSLLWKKLGACWNLNPHIRDLSSRMDLFQPGLPTSLKYLSALSAF